MIRLAVRRVQAGEEDNLREWLTQLNGPRAAEAIETFADEGCTHEKALLVQTSDGPLLVYAMEVEDEQRSKDAATTSIHPIDVAHRAVMDRALGGEPDLETVLDIRR